MPVYTGSTLTNLSYDELISWINLSSGGTANIDAYIAEAAKYGVDDISAVEDFATTYMNFYKNGNGEYTITSFNNTAQISSVNPVNSNISTIARDNVQTPLNRGIDSITGKLNITKYPASGSFGQQASYVLGSVGSAVAAVSTGISLGKVIDSALYSQGFDYWGLVDLESVNPENWNGITNGEDSWQAGLFNIIMGLDPNTGNSQAYLDENAFAYMAYALAQNGWFSSGGTVTDVPSGMGSVYGVPFNVTYEIAEGIINGKVRIIYPEIISGSAYMLTFTNGFAVKYIAYSTSPFGGIKVCQQDDNVSVTITSATNISSYTYDNKTIYYASTAFTPPIQFDSMNPLSLNMVENINYVPNNQVSWLAQYNSTSYEPISGVSNQENATLPDTSSWSDIPSTLSSLQNQYPDLWDNALVYDNYQPDGTNPQLRYIPITLPQTTNPTDTQPISGNQTQSDTLVDPSTSIQTLIDLITNISTQPNPQTEPQTETQTQPIQQNPVDTGTGNTSPVVPPTGNASALWSVYHPTQAQVNSFGAWLWGSPFLTNIGKLFTNPIDGVISLHKIFVTPVDSGTGTIVVGTLDSQVTSATVNQQYVYVDCGSINCYEDFGNVFDYPPYTQISIYLPFIGIVPLDVNDVMRSTINVTYGVDVYTGACLAMVNITRDGCTANMYQYSGVASVEYPLSNVQSSQLVSGLLAVGAGVASIVATGGVTAPAVIGIAGGSAAAMKSNVSKSGGFSGNSGAMGGKIPYLIVQRPQTKVADTFPELNGYPTNISGTLNEFTGQVKVANVHVEGIPATDTELEQIETLLKDGVLI